MKKILLVALAIAAAIFACTRLSQNPTPDVDPPLNNCFCADTSDCNTLCPLLPRAINITFVGYFSKLDPTLQPPFDIFSWQTFVALNWPSDNNGQPLSSKLTDFPQAPRVWERYADPDQIFSAAEAPLLLTLNDASARGQKLFHRFSKSPHPLTDGTGDPDDFDDEEADGHALIDHNLNFALFEIRVNPDEANFIRDSQLTTLAGIDAFYRRNNNSFELPKGRQNGAVGAMEIKASWRILDPALGDDTTQYYTRHALIYVPAKNSLSGKAFTVSAQVGLVGMHIIRKIDPFDKMIWSTFEHVGNCPDDPQAAQNRQDSLARWSFYDAACLTCPVNSAPEPWPADSGHYKWSDQPPYALRYADSVPGEHNNRKFGTQVTRNYPIYYRTEQLNQLWQTKLKGSVWANYRLVGTQWFLQGDSRFTPPNAPARLGNTTLETFIQVDASCIECHGDFAYVKYQQDSIPTDMSFIFGRAK